MRLSRVFVDAPLEAEGRCVLPVDTSRYVARVLRLRPGAPLVVFNGTGGEYAATVDTVTRDGVALRIGAFAATDRESPRSIHLGLAVARGERMDFAVQKCVELGVAAIVPLVTEHCVVRLDGARARRRVEHWRGVAASACEQSGRTRLPAIEEPVALVDWLVRKPLGGVGLVLHPGADCPLSEASVRAGAINALVGPEGGFSEAELAAAVRAGYRPVRLGPRVLRAETAAAATVSAIQLLWGDLGA